MLINQMIHLPSFDSIPISNDLLAREAAILAEIKQNGKGGLGLDEVIGALQFLLKHSPTTFITNSYTNQDISIIKQIEFLDEKIELILIPYALTASHCILIAIDRKDEGIQIFDSLDSSLSIDNIKLLKLFSNPYNQYPIILNESPYGLQKNDWECTIHVITIAVHLAYNVDLPVEMNLDTNLQYFWRAAKAQEEINAKQLAYLDNNRKHKLKILDLLEKICAENKYDFLTSLADALQIELWGNLDRANPQRFPNPNDELIFRTFRQFLNSFANSKNTIVDKYQDYAACTYLAERLVAIAYPHHGYDVLVEANIRQISEEIKTIPDNHIRSKIIEYLTADVVWGHEREELEQLIAIIDESAVKNIVKPIMPENTVTTDMSLVLVNMYKRLVQEYLTEQKIENNQVIDQLIDKKLEIVNKRIAKIKNTLKIEDEFAEFLAKEPYGIYQVIQKIDNANLVKDYSSEDLNEISKFTGKLLDADYDIDTIAGFFDRNALSEKIFVCVQVKLNLFNISLLSKAVDINFQRKKDGFSLLHEAVNYQNYEAIQLLLDKKLNPLLLSASCEIALFLAVKKNDSKSIELLLKHDSTYINYIDDIKQSALHLAVKLDYVDCIKVLIKYNADVNLYTIETPLSLAFKCKSLESFKLLLSQPNIDLNLSAKLILSDLTSYASRELLEILLKADIDINIKNKYGDPIINNFIWRLLRNQTESFYLGIEVLRLLLNHPKVNINLQDKDGYALLQVLVDIIGNYSQDLTRGKKEILIDLILSKNPDVNLKTHNNKNALQILLEAKDLDNAFIIERLVKPGVDTSCFNDIKLLFFHIDNLVKEAKLNSNIPLLIALIASDKLAHCHYVGLTVMESIKLLTFAYGNQLDKVIDRLALNDCNKDTLLVQAIKEYSQGSIHDVDELLNLGADPNQIVTDAYCKSNLIHKVLEITNDQIRNYLLILFLQYQVNVTVRSSLQMNLLEYFLSLRSTIPHDDNKHQGIITTINLLVKAGLDLDAPRVLKKYNSQDIQHSYTYQAHFFGSSTQHLHLSARKIAESKGIDLSAFAVEEKIVNRLG